MSKHPFLITIALAVTLTASGHALAQPPAGSAGAGNTAISGVPLGPGSVGGLNNSVNDPSGIGNASRAPSPAGGVVAPVQVPQGGFTSARNRPVRLSRVDGRKLSHAQQEIAVKENDKLLGQKLRSICTGC